MDANNWGPADPKGKPYMEKNEPDMEANEPDMETNKHDPEKTDDWRAQLPPASRHRIVNKIMETLKRHLPLSGQDGLQELKKIAVRFEEKIYSAATNQADYLRKISLKMLTMETKSQHALPKTFPSNVVASHNQVQSLPIQLSANESQWHQPLLCPNIGNNEVSTGVQSNVTGVQQQLQQNLLDIQLGSLSLQTNQPSVHILQQSEIPLQSESYGNVGNFLQNQEHPSNPLPPQQKMMSKTQSVPEQLQQQQSNQLLQTLQASGQAPPSFLQPQDLTNLQNQLYQSQGSLPEISFTSLDSTAETRHANGRHWQEGVYQEAPHLRRLQWQQQQQLMRLQMQQLMRLQVQQQQQLMWLQVQQQQQLQQSNKRAKTCVGDQQTIAAQTASSLAIDTPDKSATPLLAEFAGSDGARGSATATVSGKSSATMHTIKALLVLVVMVLSIVMVLSSLSLWLLLLD